MPVCSRHSPGSGKLRTGGGPPDFGTGAARGRSEKTETTAVPEGGQYGPPAETILSGLLDLGQQGLIEAEGLELISPRTRVVGIEVTASD